MEITMEQRQREREFAKKLKKLVGRRFETIGALEECLTEYFETTKKVQLDFAYQNWESDHTCDWNLICCIETEFIYCDTDIYFLWDRENRLYITEVGYEFN